VLTTWTVVIMSQTVVNISHLASLKKFDKTIASLRVYCFKGRGVTDWKR